MTGRKECKGLELSTLSKALLLILPLVVAVLALCIGRLGISPAEVIREMLIWNLKTSLFYGI